MASSPHDLMFLEVTQLSWLLYLFVGLGHGVERGAVLEPLDLALVESVGELDVERLAVLWLDDQGDRLAGRELRALDVDLVH